MSKKILKADFVFEYVIRDVNLLYWNKRIAAMKKGKKMERYKVILVDDEAEVIDMIEKKIHWNDLGFEVAGSATNGVKALELVEKLQPDVVLTDIKMPYMDGLELSRRLNREYPNIYIMLCTGFDEFEYAKEAVHLEIKEYMLKPVNATELSESLTNLKHTLDREREEKLNVKKLNDYFQEVLPKLQSNFFISLIEGRVEKHDYERFFTGISGRYERTSFCLCNLPHIGEPCARRHEPTAFIHVGRKRDQAETDGSVELSRIYIYGKYTADSGTGCGR